MVEFGTTPARMQTAEEDELSKHSVQPEVQKYLEAVFAVAPHPEEYVRYRLHLATALPLPLIDAWFENRRRAGKSGQQQAGEPEGAPNGEVAASAGPGGNGQVPEVQRFAPLGNLPLRNGGDFDAASLRRSSGEGRDPMGLKRPHADMQGTGPSSQNLAAVPLQNASLPAGRNGNGGSSKRVNSRAAAAEEEAMSAARFTEADLDAISSLVGLDTITSTQVHCGSSSLYLFEQLTALDSLDFKGAGSKRRRTRHQHFWRNTDKLDAAERVYVPISSIGPALKKRERVLPKCDIGPEERTNAWTVCLTKRGVVSYLNKRISPLGVRMIRVLQSGRTTPGAHDGALDSTSNEEEDAGGGGRGSPSNRLARPPNGRGPQEPRNGTRDTAPEASSSCSEAEGNAENGDKWERQQHLVAASTLAGSLAGGSAAIIPRARRRKPG